MKDIIGKGASFVLDALKFNDEYNFTPIKEEDQEIFFGSVVGLIEEMGALMKEENPHFYGRVVDALEKVALK